MRTRYLLLTLLFATPAVRAQAPAENEAVRVVQSAAYFIRDSLVKTRVIIDHTMFTRGQRITDNTAALVAQRIGARRARLDDVLLCDGKPKGPSCRIKDGVAVISFGEPEVIGDRATIITYFVRPSHGRLEGAEEQLTLVRLTNGSWRVKEAKSLGAS